MVTSINSEKERIRIKTLKLSCIIWVIFFVVYIILLIFHILKANFLFSIFLLLTFFLETATLISIVRAFSTGVLFTFSKIGSGLYIKSKDKLWFYYALSLYIVIAIILTVTLFWAIFIVNPTL